LRADSRGDALLYAAQVASSRSELMQMLRNMALGLMPDLLRVADGPPPEAHDFLIRGEGRVGGCGWVPILSTKVKTQMAGYSCAGLLLFWDV
jgi:hypothetical protein